MNSQAIYMYLSVFTLSKEWKTYCVFLLKDLRNQPNPAVIFISSEIPAAEVSRLISPCGIGVCQ